MHIRTHAEVAADAARDAESKAAYERSLPIDHQLANASPVIWLALSIAGAYATYKGTKSKWVAGGAGLAALALCVGNNLKYHPFKVPL